MGYFTDIDTRNNQTDELLDGLTMVANSMGAKGKHKARKPIVTLGDNQEMENIDDLITPGTVLE